MRKEIFELVIELGGQGLVMRHHQRRAVRRLDDLRGSISLAGPRHPQQNLMLLAIKHTAGQGFYGLLLIALGFVWAD